MKRLIFTLAAFGILAAVPAARATSLPANTPPNAAFAPNTITTLNPGTTLQSGTLTVTSATFSGTVRYAIYRETGGGIDFLYQVVNAGPDDINRITSSSYSGFTVDASAMSGTNANTATGTSVFDTAATEKAATTGSRTGPNPGNDATVGFDLAQVNQGEASVVLVIRTNAQAFGAGLLGLSDGSTTTIAGFAPTPEPASMVLLGGCFAGLGGFRAWRRRTPAKS